MVGDLSAWLWIGAMSADPAAWQDGRSIVAGISPTARLTLSEAYEAMLRMVILHDDDSDSDLTDVINQLLSQTEETWLEWLDCIARNREEESEGS